MASNVSVGKTTQRPIAPKGLHLAICYQIIDLGTQLIQFKPNTEPKATPQIYFGFEFCDPKLRAVFDTEKGEQPMAIFQKHSLYLGPKANLGKMLNSWLDTEVKEMTYPLWQKLVGRTAMIQVSHNADAKKVDDVTKKPIMYANIAMGGLAVFPRGETPMPKSMFNKKQILFLDHFSWEVFNEVPKFLQDMIMKSAEWGGIIKEHGQNPKDAAANQTELPEESIKENIDGPIISSQEEGEEPF